MYASLSQSNHRVGVRMGHLIDLLLLQHGWMYLGTERLDVLPLGVG
jgi:hypothetical protein